MKILFVSSRGGHFKELMCVYSIIDKQRNEIKIATVKDISTNKADYILSDILRNPISFFKNLYESIKIIIDFKPNLIISTGSGTTLNICILGKIINSKVIYIDSLARIKDLSLTGKIIYKLRIANKFLVQWKNLIEKYPRAEYWGRII